MNEREQRRFAKFKSDLWRRYRIRPPQFYKLLEEQDHSCAICGIELKTGLADRHTPNKPVVDHCHDGGHVRGLLCHACNLLIGHAKHDTDRLHRAIVYLAQRSMLYGPNLPRNGHEETDQDAEKDW